MYLGNEVPRRLVTVMEEVGALDDDESIQYFYSDALTNIRNGFYFVSDKKVVVYNEAHVTPLTIVQFDEIVDMDNLPGRVVLHRQRDHVGSERWTADRVSCIQ